MSKVINMTSNQEGIATQDELGTALLQLQYAAELIKLAPAPMLTSTMISRPSTGPQSAKAIIQDITIALCEAIVKIERHQEKPPSMSTVYEVY